MLVRAVTIKDDFTAIGNIYAQSWKAAYREIVPQAYLDTLSGEQWIPFLTNSQSKSLVIIEKGEYVGASAVSAARDTTMQGRGEIISIYLLPEYFGKGYAAPLFESALDVLLCMGYQSAYLWVLEENTRALKFYEKYGFKYNGDSAKISFGQKELSEIRLVC